MHPRVGAAYQAVIPPVRATTAAATTVNGSSSSSSSSSSRTTASSLSREERLLAAATSQPVWNPTGVPYRTIARFAFKARQLFVDRSHCYDECKALYFLQQNSFDARNAVGLLRPWEADPEEEQQLMGGGGDNPDDEGFDGDDLCFLCRDGGILIECEQPDCRRVFHPACLKMDKVGCSFFVDFLRRCRSSRASLHIYHQCSLAVACYARARVRMRCDVDMCVCTVFCETLLLTGSVGYVGVPAPHMQHLPAAQQRPAVLLRDVYRVLLQASRPRAPRRPLRRARDQGVYVQQVRRARDGTRRHQGTQLR